MELFLTIVIALIFFFYVVPLMLAHTGEIVRGLFSVMCFIALVTFVALAVAA
jgi:hypothetical protein